MLSVKVSKSEFCLSEVFSTQLVEDTTPSERRSSGVSHDPTSEQHSGQRPSLEFNTESFLLALFSSASSSLCDPISWLKNRKVTTASVHVC